MDLHAVLRQARQRWLQIAPGTRTLVVVLGVVALVVARAPQSLWPWLAISPRTLPGAHLPALFIDGLIVPPIRLGSLLLLAAVVVWLNQQALQAQWRRDPKAILVPAGVLAVAVVLLHTLLMPGLGAGFVFDAAILAGVGTGIEARLGKRRFLELVALCVLAGGAVTIVLLWLWPGSVFALIGSGGAPWSGTRALVHGLLVAWALPHAEQPLHPLPLRGKHLVWFLTVLAVFDLLFSGFAEGLRALVVILAVRVWLEPAFRPATWPDRLRRAGHETRAGLRRLRARWAGPGGPPRPPLH